MKPSMVPHPRYFPTRGKWRLWLRKNHAQSQGLWLMFYKQHVNRGLKYPEAVEEALCFGWIDGQLRRIDDRKHMLRFTPRRPKSVWAPLNIARVKQLIKKKKMTAAGLKVFTPPKHPERVVPVATTPGAKTLPVDLKRALRLKPIARQRLKAYPPSHQQRIIWWVRSAKQSATRQRRIRQVVSNLTRYAKPHW